MIPLPFPGAPGPDNPTYFRSGCCNGPQEPELDRVFFSPAHYALVLYASLIEVGRLAPEALDRSNTDGSTVEMIGAEHPRGIETTTGSLGQALSQAGGIALARRLHGEFGRIWLFMSDSESQSWEAFATLAQYRLVNVGICFDMASNVTAPSRVSWRPSRPLPGFKPSVHRSTRWTVLISRR